MTALEALLSVFVGVLALLMFLPLLIRACQVLFVMLGALIGWPYL